MQKFINTLVLSSSLLASCSFLSPVVTPEIKYYQIAKPNNTNSCEINPNGVSLLILPVYVASPFDTKNMYYSEAEYQIKSYALNQWITNPGIMFTNLIQQKLINNCIYSNVVSAEAITGTRYKLVSQLLDFKQVITVTTATMNFSMRVQLIDNNTNTVVKSKTFTQSIPVTPNPNGYIKGANVIADRFLNDLSSWLR